MAQEAVSYNITHAKFVHWTMNKASCKVDSAENLFLKKIKGITSLTESLLRKIASQWYLVAWGLEYFSAESYLAEKKSHLFQRQGGR